MFGRPMPIIDPRAAHKRKQTAFFTRLAGKLNGADDRKAAAQAKSERKKAKRLRDSIYGGVQPWQPRAQP